jgi:hypothetical protein
MVFRGDFDSFQNTSGGYASDQSVNQNSSNLLSLEAQSCFRKQYKPPAKPEFVLESLDDDSLSIIASNLYEIRDAIADYSYYDQVLHARSIKAAQL